jgi:hypothetical protein
MLTSSELLVAAAGGLLGALTGHWLLATVVSGVTALLIGRAPLAGPPWCRIRR